MKTFVCFTTAMLIGHAALAIDIQLEFLGDTFVSRNAAARAAVEAAAEHVGEAINSTLAPIDQTQFQDTAGDTTASLDWTFSFQEEQTEEPIGRFPTAVPNPQLAADTVRIFVDTQPLEDANDVGIGLPAGAAAEIGASFIPPLNAVAIQGVAGLADAEMNRGGDGPLIGVLFEGPDNLNGDIDVNPVRFRSSFGGIAFDNDLNNDGSVDAEAALLEFWHLDHTTAVPETKIDLFSVAVSEILAALGFGTSDSFETRADGRDWNGAEVAALLGSGEDLLDPIETRSVVSGQQSPRVSDGVLQEAVLDPNITAGEREELTLLDLALLRDIGWTTIGFVDLPGDYNADGIVNAADYTVWRDRLNAPPGALVNDPDGGVIGQAQYDTWAANFGAATGSAFTIPEPASAALLAIAGVMLIRRRSRMD